jgi:folate-binding protein YgfZ
MSVPRTVELDAQYRLLREGCGQLRRPRARLLEVSGSEGAEFLQGQLTNEIEALEPGAGCYTLLLDRKGKIRAELDLLRVATDQILIHTDADTVDELFKHLDTYRIGRDAEIGRLEDLEVLSLIGPRTAEVLGGAQLGAEHSHRVIRLAETDVRVVSTRGGADLVCPAPALPAIAAELEAAGAEEVEHDAAEIIRVEAGLPRLGAEMSNDTIPQEAGLNARAVSFDKGCYVGQETVARLHYKGKPNRHLRRLRSESRLEAGAPVSLGEKRIGTVGTAVISPAQGPLALAILRREAEPGSEVSVGDGVSATVEEIG